ncbi:MAG: TolC family protein [bacterium]|nr:TolC family protein [bacterium]
MNYKQLFFASMISLIKFSIIGYLLLGNFNLIHAQDTAFTLNAEQVLQLVRKFHPIAKQTQLNIEKAKADILIARSAFDPILSHQVYSKTFDGLKYYNQIMPEIKIPTWYGIELSAGTENLTGNRLDPTQTAGQTNYVGISIPLAKNLVIDKRRAALQQSKILSSMAAVEQRAVINDLCINALEAYWSWVNAYQTYEVIKNNVAITQKRFNLIKGAYLNGERPAIDTIEALTQLQGFQYQQNNQWLAFQNTGLSLSAFLWKSNSEPYDLPSTIKPEAGWENEVKINQFNIELNSLLDVALSHHPHLEFYGYKLDVLDIEKQLKFQDLLPKIDLKYNQLGKGTDLTQTAVTGPLFENNFQYGLKIEIPLRLSQGRGDYKKAKVKIEETQLDLNQKKYMINLKVRSYYNEFITLKNQIELQSSNYNNCLLLVKAEERRFQNGESSLFLINIRENKALDNLEKLIELKTKYFKTIYAMQWSAGLLQ